jgi:hypothetical protein
MLPWFLGSRGGFGGNGSWSDLIALLVVWGIFGNNGFGGGFGGNGNAALANLMNNNDGRELLMQAIQGNRDAIAQLASTMNVSITALQQSLNTVNLGIQSVGNQVGMSGLQVVNAIQSGNADLASKLASCCCETKNAITTQSYENRLATLQQTDAILAKIGEQTTVINDKFCDLEKREMQSKIDALAQQNTILRTTIDNANQTAAIQGYVAQSVAPVAASLSELSKEVTAIKGSMPNTVSVQYPNLVAMPASTAAGLYVNGGIGGYGYGYGGNGFFG